MVLKKKLSLFFLFLSFSALSQTPPVIEWEQTYGGTGEELVQAMEITSDGGNIVVGTSNSNDGHISQNKGNFDAWIIKLDAYGNIVWEKSFGGSQDDRADDVRQTSDGGFIVSGSTFSQDGDVSQNHGGEDAWVFKLDPNGNLLWEQAYGGSGTDIAYAIQQTTDNGYILAGYTNSANGDVAPNPNGGNLWVFKLDANGALAWEKTYGGSGEEKAYGIKQTTDGGYIIGGYTTSADGDVTQNQGGKDVWVLKLDNSGELVWQETFGGSNEDYISFYGFKTVGNDCIQQTFDGGYILVGTTLSNDGDIIQNSGIANIWVIKLKNNGGMDWKKTYGQQINQGASIIQSLDGNYIVTGTYSGNDTNGGDDVWVLKLDTTGTIIWEDFYGGVSNDPPLDIQQISGCKFIVAGIGRGVGGDINEEQGMGADGDYWVVKLQIAVNPPVAISPQIFCSEDHPSLADITVTGQNLQWYDENENPLPITHTLQDGATYLVTQANDGCESEPTTVMVVLDDANAVISSGSPSPTCFGTEVAYTTEAGHANYTWQVVGGSINAGGGTTDNFVNVLWTSLQNTSVSVSYDTACGPANASYPENVEVCGDLLIEKTIDDPKPDIGDTVLFAISVSNSAENAFENIEIEEMPPSGYDLKNHTASMGSYDPDSGIWTIPLLAANSTANLKLNMEVLPEGEYLNTATILSSSPTDKNPSNNSASASVDPANPTLPFAIPEGFSPNGDGLNDIFFLTGIENFPENKVKIFNRYGSLVFEEMGYDNNSTVFPNDGNNLPTGVYFYVITFPENSNPGKSIYTGWVYLNR